MKKRIFLAVTIVLYAITTNCQTVFTAADSARFSAYWWHSKDMYDNLPDIKNEIVFLGNSITDGCEWFEILGNPKCINRGISADVTEGVLLRLSAITKLKPAKIFLMIGVNDISKGKSVEEISANYRKILDQIKAESPKTRVYIESVLPVNPITNPKIAHTSKTQEIMQLNDNLRAMATEYGHQYIDLFSLMADSNNYLPRKYSVDGLHLTYAAYKAWADAIMPYVK